MALSWQAKARQRLQAYMDRHFANWCKSKDGVRWKKLKKHPSPYDHGFYIPDFVSQIIEGLDKDDEEQVKALSLQHLIDVQNETYHAM